MLDLASQILSDITVYSKYARYLPDSGRRETWDGCVDRLEAMHAKKFPFLAEQIKQHAVMIREKKVMPSMRSLQFAGKPIELDPSRSYNCSYESIDHWKAFPEIMFLLLGGTGVGYSVQYHHIEKLPPIHKPTKTRRYLIADSREGWADAVKMLCKAYFTESSMPEFDFRDIRPKGSPLKTAGGRAPGPEPLRDCLHNIRKIFERKIDGENLRPIEAHDILCFIADAVLAGGIRRSAMISLFSWTDEEMLSCKFGDWFELNPQRSRANNSATAEREKITEEDFRVFMKKVQASNSGEPGIFFTNNAISYGVNPCQPAWATLLTSNGITTMGQVSIGDLIWSGSRWTRVIDKVNTGVKEVLAYRTSMGTFYGTRNHRVVSNGEKVEVGEARSIDPARGPFDDAEAGATALIIHVTTVSTEPVFDITVDDPDHTYWTDGLLVSNCGEASLFEKGLCNLCEINASDITSQEDLNNRARAAAFFGTIQASYTDFHYLRDVWQKTADREALLGIGMTGIASGPVLGMNLVEAAQVALTENARLASLLGISLSARTTCIKPGGTVSCLIGCSSGIHAWHDEFYIRRMRFNKVEPIYQYLLQHLPELCEDDFFKPSIDGVLSLPQHAPQGAITRNESALDLLERAYRFNTEWVKSGHRRGDNMHNVSTTVSVKDDEWGPVTDWMWENRETYSGIALLPHDGHSYVQAPFESISEVEYKKLSSRLHAIDLTEVKEVEDNTVRQQEIACSAGGQCSL